MIFRFRNNNGQLILVVIHDMSWLFVFNFDKYDSLLRTSLQGTGWVGSGWMVIFVHYLSSCLLVYWGKWLRAFLMSNQIIGSFLWFELLFDKKNFICHFIGVILTLVMSINK